MDFEGSLGPSIQPETDNRSKKNKQKRKLPKMSDESEKNDEEVTLNDMMKALNELKQDVKLNHERLTVSLNAVKAELKSEIGYVRSQARET